MPERHPLNAPGPFYVEDGACITCGAPPASAPDLMCTEQELERAGHCYFKRQPYTAGEYEQAILAVHQSCCGGLRYSGKDPVVLSRLASLGHADCCDEEAGG